jgi:hypothetical protein
MTKKVHEDQDSALVTVDGHQLRGYVHETPCPACGAMLIYHEEHDSLFCPECNRWLENKCSDPSCGFCPSRPERPLP